MPMPSLWLVFGCSKRSSRVHKLEISSCGMPGPPTPHLVLSTCPRFITHGALCELHGEPSVKMRTNMPSVMIHACNLRIQEAKTGGLPRADSSQGYTVKSCQKNTKQNQKTETKKMKTRWEEFGFALSRDKIAILTGFIFNFRIWQYFSLHESKYSNKPG